MKLQKLHRFTVCAVALVLGSLAATRVPTGGYYHLKKNDLGIAPGGKEYCAYITFDAAPHCLYISHNTEVKIVDSDSGSIVGSIPDLIDTTDFGPAPAPTTEQPDLQPTPVSGTFRLLVYGR